MSTLPGGSVVALAVMDGTVLAATPAGVRRSNDAGRTWMPIGDVPLATSIAAASPQVVYAGGRAGVYRSDDTGRTWRHVLSGGALALAVVSAQTLFVGTELDGVLRSDDGGRSWSSVNPGLLDLSVQALALSPQFADDRLGFAATTSGAYRTRNGGRSWRSVDLGPSEMAVQCLSISPSFESDGIVLAGTEADGLLRSHDAGDTWTHAPFEARCVTALACSMNGGVAAATECGVAVSDDAGTTWRLVGTELDNALALAFVPHDAREVLLAGLTRAGVARSIDYGSTWDVGGDGLAARLLADLTCGPNGVLHVTDLQGGALTSADGGHTWRDDPWPVASEPPALPDVAVVGDEAVRVTALATGSDATRFAATNQGIYIARGDAFEPWNDGLAPRSIVSVACSGEGTVYALALGGSIWRRRF